MRYHLEDYTFLALNGAAPDNPITSLGYAVALVDSPENEIINVNRAKGVLWRVFDAEDQCSTAADLLETLNGPEFPEGYELQTPVMLTLKWSPIAAMLERSWEPLFLSREQRRMMNCATGIWEPKAVENAKPLQSCRTDEDLFWHVMSKVVGKAKKRGRLLSIIAAPGWSYQRANDRMNNLSLEEAESADRVIWQRTPIKGRQK